MGAGDYGRAKTHCELCLEYDQYMPECLNGLGLIYWHYNDEENAKSYFKKAIRKENEFTQSRNNLGVIFFSHGDFKEALGYFQKSLKIDPSNLDARYNLALSLFRLAQKEVADKNDKKALEHLTTAKRELKKLLALEPLYSNGFRDLGLIELLFAHLSTYEEQTNEYLQSAKEIFTKCIEADVQNAVCFEGLGQTYILLENYLEAFNNFFSCLALEQENPKCKKGIAYAFEKKNMEELGFKAFETNAKFNGKDASVHSALCFALIERNSHSLGIPQCKKALSLDEDRCDIKYLLARYYIDILAGNEARDYCKQFLICDHKKSDEQKICEQVLTQTIR